MQRLDRAIELFLFTQGLLGVRCANPFGGGAAVGRQEPSRHIVAVELPAGVVADALQPHIDELTPGDVGEMRDEIMDVGD
ncbi:MAG: hypothetical protein OXT06_24090 [Rhodospirillaceae bacterium]|nr:hypothetical protein [Rhodospirillaceae bacterium]